MFRTWYSASQIYTTIVIIFASSGMDLYFVPRWSVLAVLGWVGSLVKVKRWLWYPRWKTIISIFMFRFSNEVFSQEWLGNREKAELSGSHLLERCLVEIWPSTWGSDEVMILPYQLYSVLMTFVRKGRPISTPQKSTCSPPWDLYCPGCHTHERIEGNGGVENVANSWGILSITGRHFGKKSSNHIPRMWRWWCVIRCSWKHTWFNSVRRYLFAHLPRDILLELVAELYLRLHDAKLSLLPVHSGAYKWKKSIQGMVKGVVPDPGTRLFTVSLFIYINRASWANKCTKIDGKKHLIAHSLGKKYIIYINYMFPITHSEKKTTEFSLPPWGLFDFHLLFS